MSAALLRSSNDFLKGNKIEVFFKAKLFIYLFIIHLFLSVEFLYLTHVTKLRTQITRFIYVMAFLFRGDVVFYLNTKKMSDAQPLAQNSEDAGYNSISSRVP